MALPEVFLPAGMPIFLLEGHSQSHQSLFAPVEWDTGHILLRPTTTVQGHIVNVGLALNNAKANAFDYWFEETLDVGTKHFSARIQSLELRKLVWVEMQWVAPPKYEKRGYNSWRVTGQVRLFGEPSVTAPESTSAQMRIGLGLTGSASIAVSLTADVTFGLALTNVTTAGVTFGLALTPPESHGRETSDGDSRVTSDGDRRVTSAF